MNKFVNSPDRFVPEMLEGIAPANPNKLKYVPCYNTIHRADRPTEAEDIKVGVVLIDDDVAVTNSAFTVGRRGVAGNFFVIKACSAAAAMGASLDELVALGKKWSASCVPWALPFPAVPARRRQARF